eukprot:gene10874-42799_t
MWVTRSGVWKAAMLWDYVKDWDAVGGGVGHAEGARDGVT